MSQFYNPKRSPAWNFGGKNWKLSRSKIDLFVECPKCFYLDNKLGLKRPPGFPFNLNSAIDALLKTEFDKHRKDQTPHPLMDAYEIEAVPFQHKDIDKWRENFEGVQVVHKETGMTISGAVDDVWVDPNGELIVVDYKSTSKDGEITSLDEDWHDGYKRQMEVYQWLLRQSGFKVSDTGYFVYANGNAKKEEFNNVLEFETTVIPYEGNDEWVEPKILEIFRHLKQDTVPKATADCDYCRYREAIGTTLQAMQTKPIEAKSAPAKKVARKATPKPTPPDTGTLF